MLSPEAHSRLAALREKSNANTITLEEMQEALRILREGRQSAVQASATSKARKATRSADDMLSELGGL
jgi:hypothetical protein